jgi:hypothetical protein
LVMKVSEARVEKVEEVVVEAEAVEAEAVEVEAPTEGVAEEKLE